MKKLLFLLIIVFMLGFFAMSPLAASAHGISSKGVAQSVQHTVKAHLAKVTPATVTTCSQYGCDHLDPTQTQNPQGQLCSSGAYTVSGGTLYFTGATLELRWGPNCQTNWARWTSDGIFTCWTVRVQRQSDNVVDDFSDCGSTDGSWTNQLYSPGPARACIDINNSGWQCTGWI